MVCNLIHYADLSPPMTLCNPSILQMYKAGCSPICILIGRLAVKSMLLVVTQDGICVGLTGIHIPLGEV